MADKESERVLVMARTGQDWQVGDVFAVPLSDGRQVLGQIIGHAPGALNALICGFTLIAPPDEGFDGQVPPFVAVQFVTGDMIKGGGWPILGKTAPPDPQDFVDLDGARAAGFVGVRVLGAGIVRKFLDACTGQLAWDAMADPAYFDKLLLPGIARPDAAFFGSNR